MFRPLYEESTMFLPKLSAGAVRSGPGNFVSNGVSPSWPPSPVSCTLGFTCTSQGGGSSTGTVGGTGIDMPNCCMNAAAKAFEHCQPPNTITMDSCS